MVWPYEFHMRMLKHLTVAMPREKMGPKSSDHIYALSTILKTYPDARVIFLHRDPTKVLQASASQATILKSLFSSSIDPAKLAADEVRALTDKVNKIIAFRNNATHLSDCFIDVCYLELANDPMATVHAIYDRFGLHLSQNAEARMEVFIKAERNSRRPDRYSLSDFNLNPHQVDPRFDLYCERFGIGREAL